MKMQIEVNLPESEVIQLNKYRGTMKLCRYCIRANVATVEFSEVQMNVDKVIQ